MKRAALLALLASLHAASALANDTTAELKTGGLEYTRSDSISMEQETLYISPKRVQVDYVFRNTSDKPVETYVAFPMPDIPGGPEQNMDAGDVEGTLALVAPEAPVNLIPLQLQGSASEVGRDYFQQLASAFPNLQVRVRRLFVGSDNTAVAEVAIEGNQAADFFGILNQEKLMDLDQVWLLHVGDGAIDSIKAYWCQNRL